MRNGNWISMLANLLLTASAADRPGIVETLARAIAENGGSWLGSRLCRLGGRFAGIIQVQINQAQSDALRQALRALADANIRVEIEETDPAADSSSGALQQSLIQIELTANDRPGIVRELTTALAGLGVNVEELRTVCSSAPMSGEPLFEATVLVRPPFGCDEAAIQNALEALAEDLMVELTPHIPHSSVVTHTTP